MEDQFLFVLTGCRKLRILVTFTGPNHLNLHMGIYKSLYYKNLLSFIINVLLFLCGSTAKLAKLPQGWHFFPVVYS